jgi:phosphatidylinositol glycan class W
MSLTRVKEATLITSFIFSLYLIYCSIIRKSKSQNWNTRNVLNVFRGILQISTIISILAVDFRIYPREYAKTESFGYSIMDLGVGIYVFSSGIVVRNSGSILQGIKSTGIMLVIGFGRILLTKYVGYQEHVTEYGTHWNFFFTLGLIPLLFSVQKKFINVTDLKKLALGILVFYEIALNLGLEKYILEAPRTDLISMNREGIFSFLGYYAIFLLAVDLGYRIRDKEWKVALEILFRNFLISAVFSWNAYYNGIQVSRRMANMQYVVWIYTICVGGITLVGVIDLIFPSPTPRIIEAVNRNQLFVFLIANVLTGLVNLTIDTLNQDNLSSLMILSCYIITVSVVALMVKDLKMLRF